MWRDLLVALALVFVIEGIWPFLSPRGLKRALLRMVEQDEQSLRGFGLASMLVGVVLLYIVN